ncbi:MAG TPA: hypothetical protein K8U83_03645 [Corynebacterium stationis]|uniref:hypothetical protein n=1 Tax=Corynebacterium stationis TaxID=1705 RepID=UPI001E1AEC6A|nr:hypothetical protein [Corynebacterium stationis]HJG63864.1 hypothetical protein [Corynebacterium stationis]
MVRSELPVIGRAMLLPERRKKALGGEQIWVGARFWRLQSHSTSDWSAQDCRGAADSDQPGAAVNYTFCFGFAGHDVEYDYYWGRHHPRRRRISRLRAD